MTNSNGQNVLFCTSNADLSNLVCSSFIFIMCTAANLLAFACRKSMSCESHGIDTSTSMTTEEMDVVSDESIEKVKQGSDKENEKKTSTNVLADDCASAVPDRWNESNAVWKLDLLNVMLFSIVAMAYIFIAVVFLTFVHRYATGASQDEEAVWVSFWLQYLTLTLPSFYGAIVFLVRNKKLWYVYNKKI